MRSDSGSIRLTSIVAVLVGAASVVPFLGLLDAGFVNWDDDKNFLENESFRGLSWEHLKWMFTTFHYGGYHPLSWLSAGIDHAIWGMDPRGYHLTNILLHGINAALLFVLALEVVRRTGAAATFGFGLGRGGWGTGACAALAVLFAVHPLRVESVAWLTERRGLLAATFLILTTWSYLRAHRTGNPPGVVRRRLALAVGFFACSLLSKGLAMGLPVLLLVLDVWPLRRRTPGADRTSWARLLWEKVPFVAAAVVFGVLARAAQGEGGAVYTWTDYGLSARLAQTAYSVCYYVLHTLVPTGLCVLHPLQGPPSWGEPRFLGAGLAVLAVTSILLLRARRWSGLLVAWIGYGLLLGPVSGLAQAGPSLVAERYSYLPSMPFVVAAAVVLAGRIHRASPLWRGVAVTVFVVVAIACGVRSSAQTAAWKNSIALWTRAVQVHPECTFSRLNLGSALAAENRNEEAIGEYLAATSSDPAFGTAWYALGLARLRLGRFAEALPAFDRARSLFDGGHWAARPAAAELFYLLGLSSYELGQKADAVSWCVRALEADSRYVHAYPLYAQALYDQGEHTRAIEVLETALTITPADIELRSRLMRMRR